MAGLMVTVLPDCVVLQQAKQGTRLLIDAEKMVLPQHVFYSVTMCAFVYV